MKELLALMLGGSVGIASFGVVGTARSIAAPLDLYAQAAGESTPAVTLSQLADSEWLLEDLAGTGVIDGA